MQIKQAIYKSQNGELENGMREMQGIRVGMRGMDGNAGAENQCGNANNMCGNVKNMENQADNAWNKGGNLSMAVKMT